MQNSEQVHDPSFATASNVPRANVSDEVKTFFQQDFKTLLLTVLQNPIDGVHALFRNPSPKVYSNSLILYGSVFAFFIVGIYLLAGEYRSDIEFSNYVKLSFIPIIFMFSVSVLAFAIKSISGKPNFKNELQTGAIAGISIALLIPVMLIIKMRMTSDNIFSIINQPYQIGVIGFVLLLYIILMCINIFQQSLKASGTNDALAWYLSPIAILLAIYITDRVVEGMF